MSGPDGRPPTPPTIVWAAVVIVLGFLALVGWTLYLVIP